MKRHKRHNPIPLAAGAALATFLVAGASTAMNHTGPNSGFSPEEIVRKVEAAGYTKVHALEYEGGRWEVEATSPKGVAVDLDVDPTNGEIIHEEND